MILVNLRKYAKPKNENPAKFDQNQSPPNEREPNLQRKTRSGRKLGLTPNQSRKKTVQSTSTTSKRDQLQRSPQPNLDHSHQQVPITQTDSNVINEWKNLENPFSFSGNTATILDQIKSFS